MVINRGERDGLATGDVLDVERAGDVVLDYFSDNKLIGAESVQLPSEKSGNLMLFKTYDRIAYGLIMTAQSDIRVGDLVTNPE